MGEAEQREATKLLLTSGKTEAEKIKKKQHVLQYSVVNNL